MRERHVPSPSVVVGIDGSRAGVSAALWAVDEAVSRDIPLRLVCVIPPDGAKRLENQGEARKLASAELAVRYAITAVESTDKPVKIEVEVMQGHPICTLTEASRSAALMCLGPIGRAHFAPDRVGSTAATLASSALCPVAIVRGRDRPFADRGTILVHVGMAPGDGAVLQAAVDEARLRGLPVQAVTAWQSRFTDIHDRGGVLAGSRDVRARLNRQLAPWARRHPGVFMSSAVVHGSLVDHLAKNAKPIRMMVIGTDDCHAAEIFEPAANAVLHGADCSVLVVRSARL